MGAWWVQGGCRMDVLPVGTGWMFCPWVQGGYAAYGCRADVLPLGAGWICCPWVQGGWTVGTGWMCCLWVQDGCAAHGCRVGAQWAQGGCAAHGCRVGAGGGGAAWMCCPWVQGGRPMAQQPSPAAATAQRGAVQWAEQRWAPTQQQSTAVGPCSPRERLPHAWPQQAETHTCIPDREARRAALERSAPSKAEWVRRRNSSRAAPSPPPLLPVPSSAPTWSGAPHAEPQCPQPSPPPQRSRTIPGCQQRHGAAPQHNVPLSSGSAPPAPPACPPPHARPWALPRWERSVPSPGLHCPAQLRAAPRGQIAGGHRLFHPHRRSTRWGQKFGSAEGC